MQTEGTEPTEVAKGREAIGTSADRRVAQLPASTGMSAICAQQTAGVDELRSLMGNLGFPK